jgi:hypothetical protein
VVEPLRIAGRGSLRPSIRPNCAKLVSGLGHERSRTPSGVRNAPVNRITAPEAANLTVAHA